MRRAAIVASCLVHVVAILLLRVRPRPRRTRVEHATIELEVLQRAQPVTPAPIVRAVRDPRVHAPSKHTIEAARPSGPVAAPTSGAPSSGAPAHVDLFARGAIESVVGASAAPIHDELPESAAVVTKRRVDGWLRSGTQRRELEGGRVDPAYRQLEFRLEHELHPPPEVLKPHGYMGQLRDQFVQFETHELRAPPETPVDRAFDPTGPGVGLPGSSTMSQLPLQQSAAAMQAMLNPVWLEMELEVHVDAAGHATGLRFVMPSGYRPFDRWAEREITRVMATHDYPVPSAAKLRFLVRGSYVAHMPTQMLFTGRVGHVEREVTLIGVELDR